MSIFIKNMVNEINCLAEIIKDNIESDCVLDANELIEAFDSLADTVETVAEKNSNNKKVTRIGNYD